MEWQTRTTQNRVPQGMRVRLPPRPLESILNYACLHISMNEFLKHKIKDYKHWGVYIHHNQSYLGRCVIWCKREDALDLADATIEEREELFIVLNDLRKALKKAFQPDWFNYAFLGNGTRHLHGHFIPRYKSERNFNGTIFSDERWGHNYRTDHNFKISEDLTDKIRKKIQTELN